MSNPGLNDLLRSAVTEGYGYEAPAGTPYPGLNYTEIMSALSATVAAVGDLAVQGEPKDLDEFQWTEVGATVFDNHLRTLHHCKCMQDLGVPGPYYGP